MTTDLDIPSAEVAPATLFRSDDPAEIVVRASAVADSLAAVVRKQNLAVSIQGREHVKVEGWTLLGTMLGVFPVCVWSRSMDGEGWEARVEARTRSGEVVGAAEAMCLRDESNWKSRDDFALRSMAQTRATSKALRLPLGFVMTLAGFEATPAEEMPADSNREPEAEAEPRATEPQVKKCHALVSKADKEGWTVATEYANLLRSRFGTSHFSELSKSQASVVISELEAMERDASIPF